MFGKQEWTILFKVTGVILLWRGIWGLADLYVFPEHEALSYLISTIVALVMLWADDLSLSEIGE